jgi:putative membrane protein
MDFLVRAVATAVALWVAGSVVSGIHIDGRWYTYLTIALVFGLVNGTLGTIIKFFTFPFVLLTFGLFLLVVNSAMLGLTALLFDSFGIENFVSALLGALIISFVGAPTAVLIKKSIGQ